MSCLKVSYSTYREAQRELRAIKRRIRYRPDSMRRHHREVGAYRCRDCGDWHLTSTRSVHRRRMALLA